MKLLLKLAVAAFVMNAAVRLGSEYLTHVRFREAVRAAAVADSRTAEELRREVLDIAGDFDLALEDDTLEVVRDQRQASVRGAYTKAILLLPSYEYPWRFSWEVDVYLVPSGP